MPYWLSHELVVVPLDPEPDEPEEPEEPDEPPGQVSYRGSEPRQLVLVITEQRTYHPDYSS